MCSFDCGGSGVLCAEWYVVCEMVCGGGEKEVVCCGADVVECSGGNGNDNLMMKTFEIF